MGVPETGDSRRLGCLPDAAPDGCGVVVAAMVSALVDDAAAGDVILVMSNGGFGGLHDRLLAALGRREAEAATR